MSEISVANCPFCGGEPRIVALSGAYVVRCTTCEASGAMAWKHAGDPDDRGGRAIEKWNRRGGFGHTRISAVNPNIPAETYKYIERVRDTADRMEKGELGEPDRGVLVSVTKNVVQITQLRLSDLQLNDVVGGLVRALQQKFLTRDRVG